MYIYAYIGLNNLIAKHYTEAHSYIVKHSRRRKKAEEEEENVIEEVWQFMRQNEQFILLIRNQRELYRECLHSFKNAERDNKEE